VRRPPPGGEAATAETGSSGVGGALRSTPFIVLGLTYFACCAAHSGPIFHMVSYAMFCGVAPMAAVTIYSVEGLAGLGGRLLFGLAADRLGVKPVLIAGLMIQSIAIAAYLAVGDLAQFYTLAVIFGGAYGGVMPLYAVLARDYFGQATLGTVLGAAMLLSSLGMAFGPVAGGWIFDRFGDYAWLFVGSAVVGLAAVAMAIAFPPLARRREVPA
jgi:MFS family permease